MAVITAYCVADTLASGKCPKPSKAQIARNLLLSDQRQGYCNRSLIATGFA